MKRREALGAIAAAAATAAFRLTPEEIRRAAKAVAAAPQPFQTQFFTPHEFQTVRVLADLIIPRDERSGSATDAGVPEFMDFTMNDRPDAQVEMRGGLAWLDAESRERFGKAFVDAADAERTALLDDIAWPKKAKPEYSQGVAFFNFFRDLTASGFYSSKIGIADLDYRGNTFVREWTGCPPAALEKLGVRYES
jgi:hypothetical protein